jgi:hypothetical protein
VQTPPISRHCLRSRLYLISGYKVGNCFPRLVGNGLAPFARGMRMGFLARAIPRFSGVGTRDTESINDVHKNVTIVAAAVSAVGIGRESSAAETVGQAVGPELIAVVVALGSHT